MLVHTLTAPHVNRGLHCCRVEALVARLKSREPDWIADTASDLAAAGRARAEFTFCELA
jgi:hypothetical protein